MRQYFHKSVFLIAIFTMVAILFSLCSIAFFKEKKVDKIAPVLSDDYGVIYNLKKKPINFETYINVLGDLAKSATIGIKFDDSFCAMMSKDHRLDKLDLRTGRLFTEQDYEEKKNVVLVREDIKLLCQNLNGKLFYSYNGNEYEVIGTYKDLEETSVTSLKCIFNLGAKGLSDKANWKFGFYDAGIDSIHNLEQSQNITRSKLKFYSLQSEKGDVYSQVVSNMNLMLLLYIGVAAMILLNVFSATANWVNGKQKEITIRKLVGATRNDIKQWLIVNFMSLVVISFAIGLFFVKIILFIINTWSISSSMVMMFGNQLEWRGIILSFIILSVVGIMLITFMLKIQYKKEIVQTIRRKE